MPFELENAPDPLEAAFAPVEEVQEAPKVEEKPQTSPLEKKIDQLASGVEQNTVLTQLLAIPEIQAVLKARQTGQPVQIISGQQAPVQQQQASPEPEPDWEKIKEDPKALTEYIVKQLDRSVSEKQSRQLTEVIRPLVDKISTMENVLVEHGKKEVSSSIEAVKSKYADFEEMRPAMRALNEKVGGTLNPEDLYLLAKTKAGQPPVLRNELASERTTNAAARLPSQTMKKSYPTGRKGFEQALNDALSGQDLESMFNPSPK